MSVATNLIKIDKRSIAHVKGKLRDMKARAQNLTPAWNATLDWWTLGNQQHFGSQGKRWRTPWRELSPSSLASKRADGWMGDILVRTSTLRRSLTDRPLPIEHITPHEVVAGTNVPYAAYHHYGTTRRVVTTTTNPDGSVTTSSRSVSRMPRRPLINADAVRAEGGATSAVINWIVHGETRVSALEVKR